MLGFIDIAVVTLLGVLLVKRLFPTLSFLEHLSLGVIAGSIYAMWLFFLTSLILGNTAGILIGFVISCGLVGILSIRKLNKSRLYPTWNKRRIILHLVYSLFWIGLLFQLFNSHMLAQKNDGLYAGGGSFGDLALHSTFIFKFAQGKTVDLTSPIFSQENTTYPFLMDYYSGILMRFGFTLQQALFVNGYLLSIAITQLLFFFSLRIIKTSIGALSTVAIFLFNGGIGVFYFLKDFQESGVSLIDFVWNMSVEYAHLAQFNLRWSNIIADYFLPQRGFLAGLSSMCVVFYLLWIRTTTSAHRYHTLVLGIIVGLLPFIHMHSFLVAVGLIGWQVLWDTIQHKRIRRVWIGCILCIALLSLPQLSWQFTQTLDGNFLRIQLGWMAGTDGIHHFWLRNMGLGLLFFIASLIYLWNHRQKYPFLCSLLFPLTILFILTNIVVFQPHDYDNMKFMLYTYLVVSLSSGLLLSKLFYTGVYGKVLFSLFLFGLTITGVLSVLRETYTSWMIANTSDLELARLIRLGTPPNSTFLTADRHNHPVSMLAGRNLVMGFRGWLWTHGIDYRKTEQDVYAMFRMENQAVDLYKKYNVSYVFIGDAERNEFFANEDYFKKHFPRIISNASGDVYQVTF